MSIQSSGYRSGSATQQISEMAAGTWFSHMNEDYLKVTVSGQTPATGKYFVLRFSDATVIQLADSDFQAHIQHVGSYQSCLIQQPVVATGGDSAISTLGDIALGKFFDLLDGDPGFGIKLTVLDENGDPISPGTDCSWYLLFTGSEVVSAADSTGVESYGDSVSNGYVVE